MIREHPTEGLLALLEMSSFGDLPLRAMLIAYEHHMKIDLTGYPRSRRPRDPTLFSRIVSVHGRLRCRNDPAQLSDEPEPARRGSPRDEREPEARGLDLLLVKAFVSMIGFYPVGSVVILDTYRVGGGDRTEHPPRCLSSARGPRIIFDDHRRTRQPASYARPDGDRSRDGRPDSYHREDHRS
jgi:hypothetical protein